MSAKSDPRGNTLDMNLESLEIAADQVRDEFGLDAIKRFYHVALLECAEQITPAVFARCLEVAREQMRRPL